MALVGFDIPSMDVEPSLNSLTAEQIQKLGELDRRLKAAPEPVIKAHSQEDRRCRLLRWLRSEQFNVPLVFDKMMYHAKWWKQYGMDEFVAEEEYDETGPFFVCGEDRWGRPTVIARPAAHHAKTRQESIDAGRRAIFTLQRLVERLPPGCEQFIIIYDTLGLSRNNLDLVFAKEVIPNIEKNFPGRLHRVIVTNEHWGLSFFWAAVSVLLPACVKAKITFSGSNFSQVLQEVVPNTHPYLKYMIDMQRNPQAKVLLPAAAPYVARYVQGSDFTSGQLKRQAPPQMSEDMDDTGSVGSTVASPTDIPRLSNDQDEIFFDCREEDDEEVLSVSQRHSSSKRPAWGLFFGCSCARKA